MSIHILMALALLLPQQVEEKVDRLQQQMNRQESQISGLQQSVDRQERALDSIQPVCLVDLQLLNSSEPRLLPPDTTALAEMNLMSTVSKPVSDCLSAEVQVAAIYFDANDRLVCSGVIAGVATQRRVVETINLEVRPWNFQEFVRWKNEPPQTNSGAKRLSCLSPEGLVEASPEELGRVTSVRIRATVLSRSSGLSTAEIQIRLQR
jgi:hypothetical protein